MLRSLLIINIYLTLHTFITDIIYIFFSSKGILDKSFTETFLGALLDMFRILHYK